MKRLILACTLLLCTILFANASTVPVHDPSILVVYKDASGNSFPEQNAQGSLKKYYYIFGTQLAAAYSTDLLDWTYFTPTFSANGSVTSNYMQVFHESNGWSGWTTNDKVKENLWAPDIIYNKKMKKWCLYYSVNGDDWLSSIALLTSDKVEGPYSFVGTVVCSGMDDHTSGLGNNDYAKLMGTTKVDARYMKNGNWKGEYGSSCIDPTVLYDEQGELWMIYGSWSGGIFSIKLDENSGLRDYNYDYGYNGTKDAVWSGTTLKYDPYMGVHLAGGYYVSGEGSYIEYIKDPDGIGYYYLFISYGFYSPEGGYSLRVFRSPTLNGEYKDVTGDSPLFRSYEFNYGDNMKRGVACLQNYRWGWWTTGQTAQGHNSVLQDEDGRIYLIYHTKYDDGTIHHNVEVHQMFFNESGWPLPAPFEYRKGDCLSKIAYNQESISGHYRIIVHNSVDYKNLKCNMEQDLYLNADGSITGAYSGGWDYDYADGRQFVTLKTTVGTFHGVLMEQRMDGLSTSTLCFTSMNPADELCLWGYREPLTYSTESTTYTRSALLVGDKDSKQLAWNDYGSFHKTTVRGDFEVEYEFMNYTDAEKNWHNWALAVDNGKEKWYMRADVWNNSIFTGSTVKFNHNVDDFLTLFKDKLVRVKMRRIGTTYDVFVYVEDELVITASAVNCTSDEEVDLYLGGEACCLDIKRISVSSMNDRERVGTCNDDGTYTVKFNVSKGKEDTYEGDFSATYRFVNYRNALSSDNWDNFIVVETAGSKSAYIRADAYAWDYSGAIDFSTSWGDDWNGFLQFMQAAQVEMQVNREGGTITYNFDMEDVSGVHHTYQVIHTGVKDRSIGLRFTCEESLLDVYQREVHHVVEGTAESTIMEDAQPMVEYNLIWWCESGTLNILSKETVSLPLNDVTGRLHRILSLKAGETCRVCLPQGVYLLGGKRIVVR